MNKAEIKSGIAAFFYSEGFLPNPHTCGDVTEEEPFATAAIEFVSSAPSLMRWEFNERILHLTSFVGNVAQYLRPLMRTTAITPEDVSLCIHQASEVSSFQEMSLLTATEKQLCRWTNNSEQGQVISVPVIGHQISLLLRACYALASSINDIDDSIF